MLENPFLTKGYESAEYFCDRDDETAALISNIKNGRDTTLVSPRKFGKTGLILHTFEAIKKKRLKFDTLYVDIYATLSLGDFTKTLAEAIMQAFPERTSIGKAFLTFLKALRPTLTYDSMNGSPQLQFNYGSVAEKEYTLKSLFDVTKIICHRSLVEMIDDQPLAARSSTLHLHHTIFNIKGDDGFRGER